MKKMNLAWIGTLLMVGAMGMSFAKMNDARVRVMHASPDAPAVDVWVDGSAAISDLAYGEATDYTPLPAGRYDVQVVPAGSTSPVVIDLTGDDAINLFYNRDYTVIALDRLDSIEHLMIRDNNRPVPPRQTRLRFVHASPDAPAVDVAVVDGPTVFSNVSFRGVGDYVMIPAGMYNLEVRLAGTSDAVLRLPGVQLMGGSTYTAFAVGFAASGSPSLDAVLTLDSERKMRGRRSRRGR